MLEVQRNVYKNYRETFSRVRIYRNIIAIVWRGNDTLKGIRTAQSPCYTAQRVKSNNTRIEIRLAQGVNKSTRQKR